MDYKLHKVSSKIEIKKRELETILKKLNMKIWIFYHTK